MAICPFSGKSCGNWCELYIDQIFKGCAIVALNDDTTLVHAQLEEIKTSISSIEANVSYIETNTSQ